MKNEKALIRWMWVFALLPVIITLVVFGRLPDLIPMHWNIYGNVDSWYPKFPGAFLLPAMSIVISVLVSVLPKFDPKRENYEKFKPQYYIIRMILVIFFAILQMVILAISLGATFIKVDLVVKLMIGILFIVLGNIMPKLKHNYFVGIKTPWTISNESVWVKTHRHGGFIWFIAGFIMSGLAFIPGLASGIIYFGIVMIVSIEPIVYSWVIFEKKKKNTTN